MKYTYRLISLILLLLTTVSVRAETLDCTAITSLPTVITTQGIYCLTGNLSTSMSSGYAIEIQTNNVTIDLNGYKLGGLGAGDGTQATGFYAYQRKNITIKNGIVRGFYQGIWLHDDYYSITSLGHVVKNILADQNTHIGIEVNGFGNTLYNNTVVDTGGSTVETSTYAIFVVGSGTRVVNNTISTTTAQSTGTAFGIRFFSAHYSLIQNNTITDTTSPSGSSYAIYMNSSSGLFLRNNNLANADVGIDFGNSTGKYFNNLTFDVTTPFTGGTSVGSNNN